MMLFMFNSFFNLTKRITLTKWFCVSMFIFGITVGFIISTIYQFKEFTRFTQNGLKTYSNEDDDIVFNNNLFDHDHSTINDSLAEKLNQDVSILCWILTPSGSKNNKAIHVRNTWGKRCTKLIFFSSKPEINLDVVILPQQNNDWRQTKEGLRYLYQHNFNDADWFLKADDDTYTIMENLRLMLYEYDPKVPIFFGMKFKFSFGKSHRSYMTTRGGFVISKEALRIFMKYGYLNKTICPKSIYKSDNFEMSKCWENLGILTGDSRDSGKRARFHPFGLSTPILGSSRTNEMNYKFWHFVYTNLVDSTPSISDYLISFHYIKPTDMYVLEYFIYHLRPYGYYRGFVELPLKKNYNETLQAFKKN